MRKITLLMTLFVMVFFANATTYLNETFAYADGVLKSNWTAAGTIGTWAADWQVGGSALSYSNTGGIPLLSGLGKSLSCDYQTPYGSTNYYNYKSFNATAVTTGTIYASFLYSPNGASQNQSNATLFLLTGTNATTGVSVFVGKALAPNDATHFRFGTTRGSSTAADVKWSTTEYSNVDYASSVFFIVLKYDLDTQKSSLFINPEVGTSSEPNADATDNTSTSSTKTSLQVVEVKVNGNTKTVYKISGIKVSTTWGEAVAAQSTASPLSTPIVGVVSNLTANGFTANWTSVPNAVGYDVKVYLGTNLISTTNVSGQTTSSLAINGLMSGISYNYRVIAKGDVSNYADSNPSEVSASFTTLDPYASNALNTDFGDGSWGTIADAQPASGTYPSLTINGFDLAAAIMYNGSIRGIKGEVHTNRIAFDKLSAGGKVTFPTVNSVRQIEIHASAGTAGNGFQLKEFIPSTNSWSAIGGTYVYEANTKAAGTDSIYIIPVTRLTPTKFRIENPSSGGIYLMQVITRTNNPTLLSKPIVDFATGISQTGFNANWTPVANATAYKIYVYQGLTLIEGAPFTASGQSTESLSITDLAAETDYNYKVQAIGDGDIDYSDSFLSIASNTTTSKDTGLGNTNRHVHLMVSGKNIVAPEMGTFEIYNLQGAQVLRAENVNQLDSQLKAGLYLVQFVGQSGLKTNQKITIK